MERCLLALKCVAGTMFVMLCYVVCGRWCGVVWCVVVAGVVAYPLLSGGLSSDVETPFGYLSEVSFTPALSPRLFEFLTTLTCGARRRSHVVSTAVETVAKKKTQTQRKRKLGVHMRSAICHELVRTLPKLKGMLASMRWLLCSEKGMFTSMTFPN